MTMFRLNYTKRQKQNKTKQNWLCTRFSSKVVTSRPSVLTDKVFYPIHKEYTFKSSSPGPFKQLIIEEKQRKLHQISESITNDHFSDLNIIKLEINNRSIKIHSVAYS